MARFTRIAVVAAIMATAFVGFAPSAQASTASAEQQFVSLINQLRQAKGLRLLGVDPRLTTVARNWSAHMASTSNLYHNPNLASQAPSDWIRLGENVGYGPDVATIHKAFVNSPKHYANLVDGAFNGVGIGVVMKGSTMWVTEVFENSPSAPAPTVAMPTAPAQSVPSKVTQGYWLVARDGGIFSFGTASFKGSTGGIPLNQPIVGMAKSPKTGGYWFVAADGGIFSFNAPFFGSTGAMRLNQPIVGMAATKSGRGYWMVASDGGIFAFGDATFKGSTGGRVLPGPIVGMATTPTGGGYWFAGQDGSVYNFGDAVNHGSGAGKWLGGPVVGISSSGNGGYRTVTSAGTVQAYGPAEFDGAMTVPLNQPVVGMAAA